MKTLRRILLIILCIALMLVAIGFLLPGNIHVERRMLINASRNRIFTEINTLRNWQNWSPWLTEDTSMQLFFTGPESGVGAGYNWSSKNNTIGQGSLSITSSVPLDSVKVIMDYGENGKATGTFILQKYDHNTLLTWSFDSRIGMHPVSRWIGLFSDYLIGPDLEKGLINLELYLKDINITNEYAIEESDVPARIFISVRDTASPKTITNKLTGMFKNISLFLKRRDLTPTGSPVAVFHDYTNRYFDIEACMPVASIVQVPEGVNCSVKAAQKTIMIQYFGSYKLISGAYTALQTYITDNELQVTGAGWEEYVTNPNTEPDSTMWQTNIYFPVN